MAVEINFDWRGIAGAVAPLAPKLGAVLGTSLGGIAGPIGAGIGGSLGSLAGNALAEAFGVEATPEAVGKAIVEDPHAAEKIQQVEADRGQEILAQAQVEIERLKQSSVQFRIGADDTNRARQFNLDLVNAGSPLSWGASILASVFTIAFFVVLAFCLANTDSIKENPILLVMLGTLTAGETMILSYFFGSSAGSKNSSDRFANLATQIIEKPNPSPAAVEMVKAAAGKKK